MLLKSMRAKRKAELARSRPLLAVAGGVVVLFLVAFLATRPGSGDPAPEQAAAAAPEPGPAGDPGPIDSPGGAAGEGAAALEPVGDPSEPVVVEEAPIEPEPEAPAEPPEPVDRRAMVEAILAELPPVCAEDAGGFVSHEPPVPPMEPPKAVRGIYLNAWAFGSPRRRAQLMDLAERTEINAFVLDAKDNTGYVSYATSVPLARQIGAHCDIRVRNVRGVLAEMRERGIYPIARIVVFQDPIFAARRTDLAIRHTDGGVWIDHHRQLWADPYNREVWDYLIDLAREAVALGFAEIQWDYVRFPDVPRSYLATAVYPARAERSRQEAIREFLKYSREQLADLGVPVTADVFGLTVSANDDMGIGQQWSAMVDATDVLLPMIYPSHFARGSYGIPYPNAEPYETIRKAMEHALRRTQGIERAARIRPWLQDFTLGEPRYGPEEVRAQIRAVEDVGIDEWILWNASSRYTAEALVPLYRPPPILPDTADLLGDPVPAVPPGTPPGGEDPEVPAGADGIRPDSLDAAERRDSPGGGERPDSGK